MSDICIKRRTYWTPKSQPASFHCHSFIHSFRTSTLFFSFLPSIQYIISCLIFLPFLTVSVCKYFYFTHTWSCLFVQVIPDSTHFLSSLLSLPFLWTPLCHPQSFSLRHFLWLFSLYHSMYYMCLCLIYHLSSIIYHHLL